MTNSSRTIEISSAVQVTECLHFVQRDRIVSVHAHHDLSMLDAGTDDGRISILQCALEDVKDNFIRPISNTMDILHCI
jgi:hypothetical protein